MKISANGDYLYRGEPECYPKVSSGLYRQYSKIEAENFDIEAVQKEILEAAKRYTSQADDFEILTELQHYGYNTNLIDFTTNYNIALFFACDSNPDKDGRIILLRKTNSHIVEPQSPVNRIIAQKSVFVRPPKGFIDPDETVLIPNNLKQPLLEYLRNCQDITAETIYNDLHGFIRYQNVHQSAYTEFFAGVTYSEEKDYSKTIKHYSNAIKLNPQMVAAYSNRGLTYDEKGEFDLAFNDFNKAIELDPDFAKAFFGRGLIYIYKKEFDSGVNDFNKAIELDPDFATVYLYRGIAYSEKREIDPAIDDLNKAIELNSEYAEAYFSRGICWLYLQKWQEARSDLTVAKNKGVDIIKKFCDNFKNVGEFEQKYGVQLPEDIAAMLTQE